MPERFSPSAADAARQWQAAIAAQQQRDLARPSMGQRIGDIINWNLSRAIYGNPLAQIAQMYQDMRSGQLDPATGAQRGFRTALSMVAEGMPYARPGTLGMAGGLPGKADVLRKLLANRDFAPQLRTGRMWFRSLSPAENETMNAIGWSRADNVTLEDELGAQSARAWETNIRHWLNLATPSKDKS